MTKPTTWPRRIVRAAVGVVASLLAVWGLYVLGASIALSAWGMGKVFEGSHDIQLDHMRAWSVWPGVVHAHDIRIRMQDDNVEFVLEMKEADVTVVLTDLVHRTLHATKVRGSGAVFRFRSRVAPEDAHSPTVAGYPPIPPYDDPPIAPVHVQPPPIPESEYKLWSVRMEDVDVGLAEGWLHEIRYVAHERESRARGAFALRPAKHLWVGPATLDLAPGEVSIRGQTVLDPLSGHVDCTVWPFDVYEPRGMEPLAFIDMTASLEGQVRSVGAVSAYLPADVNVEDGSGQLVARIDMKSGVLGRDTSVYYETARLRAVTPHATAEGPVEGWLRVAPDDYEAGRVFARMAHVTVRRPGIATPLLVTHLVAEASSTTVALTSTDPAFAGARVEVGEAHALDARWLEWPALHPGGQAFRARGGPLSLSGGVALSADHLVSGALQATAVVSSVTVLGDTFGGSVRAHTRFDHVRLDPLVGSAHATVSGRGLSFTDGSGVSASATRLEVDGSVTLGPARARHGQARIDLSGASATASRGLSFQALDASVRASLETAHDGTETGTVTASVVSARMARPTSSARGDVGLTVRFRATPAHDHADLTAGLRLTRVALRTQKKSIDDWSAEIDVTGARIDEIAAHTGPKRTLDGAATVTLRFRDGTPLLAVLTAEDQLPSWIQEVLGGAPVYGSGRLHLAKDRVDLVLAKAVEGPLALHGCIARVNRSVDGAVLVELSGTPLAVGLGIKGGGVHVAPLVGEGWLQENGGAEAKGAICGTKSDAEKSTGLVASTN